MTVRDTQQLWEITGDMEQLQNPKETGKSTQQLCETTGDTELLLGDNRRHGATSSYIHVYIIRFVICDELHEGGIAKNSRFCQ